MIAIDMVSGKKIWDKTYEGGCDRLAISPDGKTLYVPQLEGPNWHVVDAANGNVIATIETKSGSHNTIYSNDGTQVYLAGLKSPAALDCGSEDAQGGQHGGAVCQRDPAVYREWREYAGVRQHQRPAGLRSGRYQDRARNFTTWKWRAISRAR